MEALVESVVEAVRRLHQIKYYDAHGWEVPVFQGHGGFCRECGRFGGRECRTMIAVYSALGRTDLGWRTPTGL